MTDEQQGQPPTRSNTGDIIESVITKGDLGKLTPTERTLYYREVCRSIGLNPLTQPFAYIVLNGKLTLYASKGATDQLRTTRSISVEEMTENVSGGIYVVTCKVRDADGRTDVAKGAVPIDNLKGEALANAIMKAETKAKRRATLSICGLGMLDESEIESIDDTALSGPFITPEQIEAINALLLASEADLGAFEQYMQVTHIGEILAKDYRKAERALQAKLKQLSSSTAPHLNASLGDAALRVASHRSATHRHATSSPDEREPGEEG